MQQYQHQEMPIEVTLTIFMHFYLEKHKNPDDFRRRFQGVGHDPLGAMAKAAGLTSWMESRIRTSDFMPHEGVVAVPQVYDWMQPNGQGRVFKPHELLGVCAQQGLRSATLPEMLLWVAVSDWPRVFPIPYNKKYGRPIITFPSQQFGGDAAVTVTCEPSEGKERRELRFINSSTPVPPEYLLLVVPIDAMFMRDLPRIGLVCVH